MLERRRALGQDLYDEVWEGEYDMAPAPERRHARLDDEVAAVLPAPGSTGGSRRQRPLDLGRPDDFRVPDRGVHRGQTSDVWLPTAADAPDLDAAA